MCQKLINKVWCSAPVEPDPLIWDISHSTGDKSSGGGYTGRKATARAKKDEMIALLEQGMSKPKIAKELGVSVASVYNTMKS